MLQMKRILILSHCTCFRYTLGNVFDKDYSGQDPSKPYVDHVAIPSQLVPQYANDGVLQISIELDAQVCDCLLFLQFRLIHPGSQRLPETIQWPVGTFGTVNLPGLLNDVCIILKLSYLFCTSQFYRRVCTSSEALQYLLVSLEKQDTNLVILCFLCYLRINQLKKKLNLFTLLPASSTITGTVICLLYIQSGERAHHCFSTRPVILMHNIGNTTVLIIDNAADCVNINIICIACR